MTVNLFSGLSPQNLAEGGGGGSGLTGLPRLKRAQETQLKWWVERVCRVDRQRLVYTRGKYHRFRKSLNCRANFTEPW